MRKKAISIAVTGGAGNISYHLLFRIASGEIFGPDQPINLRILEIPQALNALEGVKMELEDCSFPLLEEIQIGIDPVKAFDGAKWAFLIGAKPRGPNMERKDLLSENGKIFIEQGKALNKTTDKSIKVFVVGNPCNTNCLLAMLNAPTISDKNFFAMTRLDQNRAAFLLAKKADVPTQEVKNVCIWGNHSSTLVPDFIHAKIQNKPAMEIIKDHHWLENQFIERVQKRGAMVIKARGSSSAASAAHAIVDSVKSLLNPTKDEEWYSMAVASKGNPYGVDENLIFSFPCRTKANGEWEIVRGLNWNQFLREKIFLSQNELLEEKKLALHSP